MLDMAEPESTPSAGDGSDSERDRLGGNGSALVADNGLDNEGLA